MQRRTYVAGIGSVLAAGVAGCSALGSDDDDEEPAGNSTDPNSSDGSSSDGDSSDGNDGDGNGDEPTAEFVNGSFESGLEGWTVGTDLPTVPGKESGTVDHGVSIRNGPAADGDAAVQFYISGVADDGTIWVEQQVDFSGVSAVEVAAYSEQTSFNEIAMLAFFAGEKPEGGLTEDAFDREKHVEDHDGWKTYTYDVSEIEGVGTLAVGMNVIWETEVRRLFDDVRLVSADD
ncbi:hypothetical protein [Salinarchaeum laminariae]|uniref:hypothetical protein n=1 Tax=Salinarchaeum laminariae TaxID=869888 RepID=UPI0020C152F1|nr:hypothetical protein [Salinarchaeum laminariae]